MTTPPRRPRRRDLLDEAARQSARDGLSRRQALRLLLGGSAATATGFSVVGAMARGGGASAGSATLATGAAPAAATQVGGAEAVAGTTAGAGAGAGTAANNCPIPNTLRPLS